MLFIQGSQNVRSCQHTKHVYLYMHVHIHTYTHTHAHTHTHIYIGVGNDIPLQYPCLENPKDRRTWRASVHGVAKSQTRLNDWACMQVHGLLCPPPGDLSNPGTELTPPAHLSLQAILYHQATWDGEGNGNPLQCSCLENPRDGGAW